MDPRLAPPRRRRRRGLAVLLAAGLALGLLPALPAHAGGNGSRTWVVQPGQSIQAAVDRARSGDTVRIRAGVYKEAVCVQHKALTVVGAGAKATVIAVPDVLPASPCWVPGAPEGQPVENVSALKFLYPDGPVEVSDLGTYGHPESGIVAWGARGFTVTRTRGTGHKIYGILATAGSTRVRITDNVEQGLPIWEFGRSGTAGISVGDSADARAVIRDNVTNGTNLGIFVREARHGRVEGNRVSGSCGGILVFDDANTEKPTVTGEVIGGDWDVVGNVVQDNTRFCLAGRQGDLRVSGVGVAVVNADDVRVSRNLIQGNRPSVPADTLNFPTAGLSILTVPSPTGGPDPGPATNVRVTHNVFRDNALDILLGTPPDTHRFAGNRCRASIPASICGG